MAQLTGLYLKLDTLKTIVSTLEKKQETGISFTLGINDDCNQYDQNVAAWVEQSEEQRNNKAPKYYVGNGRTFWANGGEYVPKKGDGKKDQPAAAPAAKAGAGEATDDLPF